MKSLLKFLLPLLGLSLAAIAQPAKGPEGAQKGRAPMMNPEQRIEQLDKALTLSADQKAKILEVYKKQGEKMQALQGAAQEDRRTKMREIGQETQKEVRALLTAEQQKKFDEMRPGRGGPGGKGGEGRKGKGAEKQN